MNVQEAFLAYQRGVDELFSGIKQSVPRYHQSITNVQQEYLLACEGMAGQAMSLQQEMIKRTDTATVPDEFLDMVQNVTKELFKAASVQSQMILAGMDSIQQNIKTFNDNAKPFADLNRDILESWMSLFSRR